MSKKSVQFFRSNFAASYDVKHSRRAMKPFSQFPLDINLLLGSARVAMGENEHHRHVIHS